MSDRCSPRLLVALCATTLIAGVLAGKTVKLTDACPTPKDGATELVCSYTLGFQEMKVDDRLELSLHLPTGVETLGDLDRDCSNGRCAAELDKTFRRDRHIVYKFKLNKTLGAIKFNVVAPIEDYEPKKKAYYIEINGDGVKAISENVAAVPVKKKKTSLVRPTIGGGFTRLRDDFVDFKEVKETDEHIFTDNDSKWRAEVLGGALFKLHEFKGGRTVDVAVNLEFADGGESSLDGIFLGLGFGWTSAIEFVGGYSLGRGKELSRGFQRAMGRFVMERQGNPAFPQLQDIAIENGIIANIKDYDGLPLSYASGPNETERIFPGNPINNSFNSKFSFGVLIPLDIWKQVKGDDK